MDTTKRQPGQVDIDGWPQLSAGPQGVDERQKYPGTDMRAKPHTDMRFMLPPKKT